MFYYVAMMFYNRYTVIEHKKKLENKNTEQVHVKMKKGEITVQVDGYLQCC